MTAAPDRLAPSQLSTARLTLRPFVHADWPSMHEHYSDPECTGFTLGRTLTEGESWRTMAGMVGHWALRGYGPYAIVETASQQVLGAAGPWYPNDWPEPEIKWALIRRHWGQGFASEAVRAVQLMAMKQLGPIPLISMIHPDNQASIRLALAVGAVFEREHGFRGAVWRIYRHPGR